jgi:hypothetical protein
MRRSKARGCTECKIEFGKGIVEFPGTSKGKTADKMDDWKIFVEEEIVQAQP